MDVICGPGCSCQTVVMGISEAALVECAAADMCIYIWRMIVVVPVLSDVIEINREKFTEGKRG